MSRYPIELEINECFESITEFKNGSVTLYDITLRDGCSFADIVPDLREQYSLYGKVDPPSGDIVIIDDDQPSTGVELA